MILNVSSYLNVKIVYENLQNVKRRNFITTKLQYHTTKIDYVLLQRVEKDTRSHEECRKFIRQENF